MKLAVALIALLLSRGTQAITGTVEGTVMDSDSSAPIANATVALCTRLGSICVQGIRLQTVTDSSGYFSFKNLPAGLYLVTTNARQHARAYNDAQFKGVAIPADGASQRADLTLTRLGSVRGRVYNRDGTPIVNESVGLLPTTYTRGQIWLNTSSSVSRYTAQTNAQGDFEIRDVMPAEYYAAAGYSDFGPAGTRTYFPNAVQPANARPVVVFSGTETVVDIEHQNVMRFKVSGRIVDEVPAGGPHEVSALYLLNRDTRVRDDVPPNEVSSPSRLSSISPAPDTNRPTVFRGNMEFEIGDVHQGSYDVVAIITVGNVRYLGRASVDIVDRNFESATVVVRPGVTVSGNAQFRLQPMSTTPSMDSLIGDMAYPVGANDFRIENVPPGLYTVGAVDPQVLSDVLQNGVSIYDSGLKVDTTTPSPIEMVMARATGSIRGTVRSGDPRAVPYAWVSLAPAKEHRQNPNRYKTVRADADGRFAIQAIPPGEYKLLVFNKVPYFASANPIFISRHEPSGVPVIIKGSDTLSIDAPVIQLR